MDIGTGLAIAGSAASIAAVFIKWIGSNSNNKQCASHAMIAQQIINMESWLEKVEAKLDRVIERL